MKNYIWLIAAAVVLVAMVGWRVVPGMLSGGEPPGGASPVQSSTPQAQSPTSAPNSEEAIFISMASSSTKKEWLDEAISGGHW